tara:strand:+ start:144 stop:515 length:372 start_codon:yes stop_codon:yes gene_type:complete
MVTVKLVENARESKIYLGGKDYSITRRGIIPEMPSRLIYGLVNNPDLELSFEASDRKSISDLPEHKLELFYTRYGVLDKKMLLNKLFPTKSTRQKVQKAVVDVVSTPVKKTPVKKTPKKGGKK